MFYVLVVLFEVGIFAYFSATAQEKSSGWAMLLFLAGFLGLDLYIIYIFHKISQMREKERQTDLMQQHQQLPLQMYRELQKLYQQTCYSLTGMDRGKIHTGWGTISFRSVRGGEATTAENSESECNFRDNPEYSRSAL